MGSPKMSLRSRQSSKVQSGLEPFVRLSKSRSPPGGQRVLWPNCVEATTFTVANLYYVQPILFKIAGTFDISFERASSIATLSQAGYACGLLLLCPLGDIFRRRLYILALVAFTATLVSEIRAFCCRDIVLLTVAVARTMSDTAL